MEWIVLISLGKIKVGREIVKNILIFSHAMELGGAEKALLGLLETIDTTKYQVDLFLMRHTGELYKYIPSNINILPEKQEYASLAVSIIEVLKKRKFKVVWGRFRGKLAAKNSVKTLNLMGENDVALEYSHKYTVNAMPQISDKRYDLAISFLTPHYFVAQKVQAKKKIAWIHTDYSVVAVDKESQLEMWRQYDIIASISEKATENFVKVFPELEPRVQVIENIMPIKYIKRMAEKNISDNEIIEDETIKLLSIGRFCTAKNFDNVSVICARIRDKGINVKWYLIGYGPDEELINRKIEQAKMQDYVIILGKKENPYPYIKACDIYIQPSRYEGKCVSVIEAQILQKPTIITKYSTSASQLEDGVDGIIVPMDNEGCAEGIAALLNNPEKMKRLSANCKLRDYTNKKEINKIYRLMDERNER